MDRYSTVAGTIPPRRRVHRHAALTLATGLLAVTIAGCERDRHTLTESTDRGRTVSAGAFPGGPSDPFGRGPLGLGVVQTQVAGAAQPASVLQLPAKGTPVTVKGLVHGGLEVTVNAERLSDGTIAFIDSSQPGADRTTGKGLSVVYDGARLAKLDDLPGPVATMREGDTPDIDVLSAAWAAKATLDYYRTEHSRASYDAKGAPVLSIVHVPQDLVGCTHYFENGEFVASGACTDDGKTILRTGFDIGMGAQNFTYDILSRETPDLFGTSSSGPALLIGTADYFGTVIQNRTLGTVSSSLGGTRCLGEPESYRCLRFADGSTGARPLDSGVILDDGAFVLREPLGVLDAGQQYGGRFDNSLVWSNALWQIRKAFASQDGGDLIASAAAARFDRIVYRATTVLATTEPDMAAAAAAVLQAAVDLQASPAEQAVIQQQFVLSQLCGGCNLPTSGPQPTAATPRIEYQPAIVNGGIVYRTDRARGDGPGRRTVTMFAPGGDQASAVSLTPPGTSDQHAVAAGDWVVQTRYDVATSKWLGIFLRRAAGGTDERLDDFNSWAAPAISADTVAWSMLVGSEWVLKARSTAGGLVATMKLASLPIHLGVDGSLVAYQLQDGTVGTWDLRSGATKVLGKEPGMPDSVRTRYTQLPGRVAVSGSRVAVIVAQDFYGSPNLIEVFDTANGSRSVITKSALPAGVAMDRTMVVWSEVIGKQASPAVAIAGVQMDDADLMSYSFATGTYSVLLRQRGQQGFPTIGGGRLAWQDSAAFGDDISSAALPSSV